MEIGPDLLEKILSIGGAAAATYGAIRADLKSMKERIIRNEQENDRAHTRIDAHLETQHNRRKSDG